MVKYDFVIVGSGLGGLECATILSKEGYSVCLLEKNPVVGGCFQSFNRAGHVLDTGIHYVGSLDSGQILNQCFSYFNVLDKVVLKRLDNDAFDIINYQGQEYKFSMGFDQFVDTLADHFPQERDGLASYIQKVRQVYDLIGVDKLQQGVISAGGMEYFSLSASQIIEDSVTDRHLRNILAGNITLYGGAYDSSTFYHHAMVTGSNIAGAYRFVDGSQSVADAFVDVIKQNGGVVRTKSEVTKFVMENGSVASVEVNGEEQISAKNFISNVHPSVTLQLIDKNNVIKKAYHTRISSLPNSYGLFTVYLVMKKDTYKYLNSNVYFHASDDAWYANSHPEDKQIKFVLMCSQATSRSDEFADVVTLLSPMHYDEVERWADTKVGRRGSEYADFKEFKTQQIINFCAQYDSSLKACIERVFTSSPLTYRDYTATPEGSAYGIMKSYKNPLISLIPSKTKIDNLYFTGQNLNVHGALGVTLTSMLTCAEFLGKDYLARKIGYL